MVITLVGVSSQNYLRLLEADKLAFSSEITCFLCRRQLWLNGYGKRSKPWPFKPQRLKCSLQACSAHYTVLPGDIVPGRHYDLETIEAHCKFLNQQAPERVERAFEAYKQDRETRIEDGLPAGPDASTLRRWHKDLNNLPSAFGLYYSTFQHISKADCRQITAFCINKNAPASCLTQSWPLSLILPVTAASNFANSGASSKNNLNFSNQEHPP